VCRKLKKMLRRRKSDMDSEQEEAHNKSLQRYEKDHLLGPFVGLNPEYMEMSESLVPGHTHVTVHPRRRVRQFPVSGSCAGMGTRDRNPGKLAAPISRDFDPCSCSNMKTRMKTITLQEACKGPFYVRLA